MVELVRLIPSRRLLRRALHRLPDVLFPPDRRLEALAGFVYPDRAYRLDQYSRYSDGRQSRHGFRNIYFYSRDCHDRPWSRQMASQSVRAAGSAEPAFFESIRSGPRPGPLALLRIRATFLRSRGSRESAAQLSESACYRGAAFHRDLLPADVRCPGRARKLATVERWILLHRRSAHRRPLARQSYDDRRHGRQRGAAQQHRAHHYAHALRTCRRRIPAAVSHPPASALRHALDRDFDFRRDLCIVGAAFARRFDQYLRLAARRHHRADRPLSLGTAPQTPRFAASVSHPRRQPRTDLRDRDATRHDLRRPALQ